MIKLPRIFITSISLFASLQAMNAASTYKWDADGDGSSGTPTTVTSGSGTWDTTSTLWNVSGSTDVAWVNGNAARFGSPAADVGTYTITVDASVTTLAAPSGGGDSLTFQTSEFTLTANSARTLDLSNGSINVAAGISAVIGNNINLTNVSGINSGSISESTLTLKSGSSLTSSNQSFGISDNLRVVVNTGATLSAPRILLSGTSTSDLIVDGGTVNVTGATLFVGLGSTSNGTGHLEINNGAVTATSATTSDGYLQFGPSSGTPSASTGGIVDLNGGTLTIAQILTKATNNAFLEATFNFNGGTLKAKTATSYSTTFMQGIDTANVRNGGAIIDTNGQSITIGQALVHSGIGGDNAIDGGLTKRGTGTLTLTAVNTFTGGISIEAGTLSINNAFINDSADVRLLTGTVFNLNFSATDTIGGLYIDGIAQNIGTYGSISSTADFKSALFTGSGLLNVTNYAIPEPSSTAALAGLLAIGVCTLRRRRG